MNNIIDQTTMTSDAVFTGGTIEVVSGKLRVASGKITSNEIANNTITTSDVAFANSLLPTGAVMAFAMDSAPAGWQEANGTLKGTGGVYAALFAAIGYTYGGSGDQFRLPDLRGYFVRGSGTNSDGTASGTFGAKQQDEFKAHTHTVGKGNIGGGSFVQNGPSTGDTLATGSTGGDETRPKNIAMLYCIKL
jgi:microcystin-dependent protein